MKSKPITHRLGQDAYSVSRCAECGQNVVHRVNTFFGQKAREQLKAQYPMLPDFPADEICECAANEEDE